MIFWCFWKEIIKRKYWSMIWIMIPSNESLGWVNMHSPNRNTEILSLTFLFANPYWANIPFTLIVFKVSIDSIWGILNFQNLRTSFYSPNVFLRYFLVLCNTFLFSGFQLIREIFVTECQSRWYRIRSRASGWWVCKK